MLGVKEIILMFSFDTCDAFAAFDKRAAMQPGNVRSADRSFGGEDLVRDLIGGGETSGGHEQLCKEAPCLPWPMSLVMNLRTMACSFSTRLRAQRHPMY